MKTSVILSLYLGSIELLVSHDLGKFIVLAIELTEKRAGPSRAKILDVNWCHIFWEIEDNLAHLSVVFSHPL